MYFNLRLCFAAFAAIKDKSLNSLLSLFKNMQYWINTVKSHIQAHVNKITDKTEVN